MAAIEVANLTRTFHVGDEPVHALDGVDLSLSEGELAAVVGPSGSGKSTLLALLGGLDTPTSGSISVDGRELAGLSPDELAAYRCASVGFIFQDFFLLSHLTALENVETPLKLAGVPAGERKTRAAELIELVGLAARGDHLPRQLSGGERQRVAIARAMLHNPRILILDEATSSVDVETEKQIQAAIGRMVEGRTTFAVSHRLSTLRHADRLMVLDAGRVVEVGSHEELMERKGAFYELVNMQREASRIIAVGE